MAVDEFDLDIKLEHVEAPQIDSTQPQAFSHYGRCISDGTLPHTCSC